MLLERLYIRFFFFFEIPSFRKCYKLNTPSVPEPGSSSIDSAMEVGSGHTMRDFKDCEEEGFLKT